MRAADDTVYGFSNISISSRSHWLVSSVLACCVIHDGPEERISANRVLSLNLSLPEAAEITVVIDPSVDFLAYPGPDVDVS